MVVRLSEDNGGVIDSNGGVLDCYMWVYLTVKGGVLDCC
jgi:hypothetical protein